MRNFSEKWQDASGTGVYLYRDLSVGYGSEKLTSQRACVWYSSHYSEVTAAYFEGDVKIGMKQYSAVYFDAVNDRAMIIDEVNESQNFESRAIAARTKYQR